MRFAVIDDDEAMLHVIPEHIRKAINNQIIEIDCFISSQAYLEHDSNVSYDTLFLDIDMPVMNGFELAAFLRDNGEDIPIVYITGRDDLIINAFRYKPIGFVRKLHFDTEMQFAISTIISELQIDRPTIIMTEPKSYGGKSHTIYISDITYIENLKHYLTVHLISGNTIIVREKISYYADHNDFKNFVYIIAGTLVNLAHITVVNDTVMFKDRTTLYISRRRVRNVLQAYLKYVKKVLI